MTRTVSKIGRHLVVLFITKSDANADFYRTTTHSFEVFVNLVAFIIADNIVMTWGRICWRKKSLEEEERKFRIEAIFFRQNEVVAVIYLVTFDVLDSHQFCQLPTKNQTEKC